jgi:hypothetical protein
MSRKKNSRQWARLRILCHAGLDLMTIVPDAFGLVRELIPNSSAHLILRPQLPAQPAPGAAPGQDDAVFAQVLPPPQGYFYSDHAGFVEPASAPVHVLEVALKSAGNTRGEIVLWRKEGTPFDHHDEEDLERVAGYLEQALRHAPELGAGGAGVIEDEAMLLATGDGQILYLSDSASALLNQLAAQERQAFERRTLPPFCMRLVESVVHGDRYPWLLPLGILAMGGGVLEARAQWMSVGAAAALHAGAGDAASRTVGIFMKFVVPLPLRIWRAIGSVELSPQQAEVAFWMGVGGGRESARANMDVSDAVLRDCVKAVYEKFGCSSEAGLLEQLRPAISRM